MEKKKRQIDTVLEELKSGIKAVFSQVIERAKTKSEIRTIPLTAKGREILSLSAILRTERLPLISAT